MGQSAARRADWDTRYTLYHLNHCTTPSLRIAAKWLDKPAPLTSSI